LSGGSIACLDQLNRYAKTTPFCHNFLFLSLVRV
jgi:hypothetical protein